MNTAQAATVPTDAVAAVVQTGAIGALLVLALLGLYQLYKRIINNADEQRVRAEKAEAEVRELNKEIRGDVLKTLTDATHAISSVIEQLKRDRP